MGKDHSKYWAFWLSTSDEYKRRKIYESSLGKALETKPPESPQEEKEESSTVSDKTVSDKSE